jgi:threonine/homoserine/homoserine lactone efflux protein
LIESLLIGSGFALAAALQPGPLQAFLFSSVTRQGLKKTLPAALAPVLSDGPIALIVLLVINRLPQIMTIGLQLGGGVLLLYFAYRSYKQWQAASDQGNLEESSIPRTMFQAALVNLLNPNPYLGWSLVLGPAVMNAWSNSTSNAIALIAAFYITIVTATMGLVILFGLTGFLSTERRRWLILLSAVILAILGGYQVISGILRLQIYV